MPSWILLLFFLSGFSALIYEVAWIRILGLTLGNTAQATSCVLAVFLGGLAVGAVLGGRAADKIMTRRLLAYGVVELGIALSAPLSSEILKVTPGAFVTMHGWLPESALWLVSCRLILSGALLVVPTIFMGATLPMLIRYVEERQKQPAQLFARLYGVNTLGAVCGSLAACFLGFAYLGITWTVGVAALINALIGCSCILVSMLSPAEQASLPALSAEKVPVEPANKDFDPRLLSLIAAITGFTALSYEVLWTRLLRFYTTSLTYAFTFMVSTFLLGLALGSFIYERRLHRPSDPFKVQYLRFANLQYFAAIACAGSLLCVPLAVLIKQYWFMPVGDVFVDPGSFLLLLGAMSCVSILVPSIILGISFPMIGALAISRAQNAARSVSIVYGANTLGCVAGSLISGLALIPSIGSYKAFQLTILLSVLTGILAALNARPLKPWKQAAFVFLPAVCALSFVACVN